jgi:DNA processing protein
MDSEKLKYWLALKSIAGIGNALFSALIDRWDTPEAVFSSSAAKLQTLPGITKKIVEAIAGFKSWDKILRELERAGRTGISIVTFQDELYPAKLLQIYDRPAFFYTQGKLLGDDINIAVVGSRLASTYGKYTTERISRELAALGVTVVSGMARGIDSAAHRGALAAHGRTIAVLGSGLDIVYPPENKKLFAAIIEHGAVVSEFPLGTEPLAFNFPTRNRIISGMSYGVVVVEAGEKSGSLITAKLALEQGREVFAVPGSIDSAHARGTNKLIKQGAKLIENTGDILEEILPQLEKTKTFNASSVSGAEAIKAPGRVELNRTDQKIMDIVSGGCLHIDEIIAGSGLAPAEISSTLMVLELKGLIRQHPGKFFSLKK